MGREQRRKYAKKYGKQPEPAVVTDDKSLKKYIKIIVVVLLIVGLFYLLSATLITKELGSTKKENKTETKVDNTILAKNSLRQTDEIYYVYYYDFNNKLTKIENNISKLDNKVYRVNTSDALNSNFVSEESNPNAKALEEIKIKAPTLIKVENGTILEYYETEDNILLYLN